MKKRLLFLMLVLIMSFSLTVRAEGMSPLYDTMLSLMDGRQFTLTLNATGTDELAPIIASYGTVICKLYQEDQRIILTAGCDGDARLEIVATPEDVKVSTNLIEAGEYTSGWDSLQPVVVLTEDELSVRLTFPNHEWISFSCKIKGTALTDCELEIRGSYMTGPGVIHSLWDGLTSHGGETSREFYLSFAEDEYAVEGEGTESIEFKEDGGFVVIREDECLVTHNDEETGTLTIRSTLEIR